MWTDEALTIGATAQLADTLRETGGTMALYYAVVTPIAELSTDRFWLRLPSALFVAVAVAVTYLVGRRLGGRAMAATSSLALASTWALARWGIEARGYGLAIVLVALSWLGLVEAVLATDARHRRRWWALFGAAALLAPFAHGLAALQLPFQAALLLVRADRRAWARRLAPIAVAWGAVLLGLFALGAGEVASWIEAPTWSDLKQVYAMLVGRGGLGVALGAVVLAGTALSIRAAVRRAPWRTDDDAGWLPLVAVTWGWGVPVAVLAISLVRPYQEPRYLVTSLPGVALLTGSALVAIRPVALQVAATGAVLAALLSMQPAVTASAGEDWSGVVEVLAAEAREGDELVMRPLLRAPFDHAVGERGEALALSPLSPPEPIGEVRRLYTEPEESIRSMLMASDAPVVWLVVRGGEAKDEVAKLRGDEEFEAVRSMAEIAKRRGQLAVYRFRLTPER